jgi:hypothetical protein
MVETLFLTVNAEFGSKYQGKSVSDELYGILEGTSISSYKFAKNKKHEKELEEENLIRIGLNEKKYYRRRISRPDWAYCMD